MVPFRLFLITDRRLAGDLPGAVAKALAVVPRGAAAVQLREKDLPTSKLLELARALVAVCRPRGAPLLINDRPDVALASAADGVHLTGGSVSVEEARSLLGQRLIGASCHTPAELEARAGADFATFSPIFPSPGKGDPLGLGALASAARSPVPLFALGGVDASNAGDVIEAGAQGVAAIRSWLLPDPASATALLHARISAREN